MYNTALQKLRTMEYARTAAPGRGSFVTPGRGSLVTPGRGSFGEYAAYYPDAEPSRSMAINGLSWQLVNKNPYLYNGKELHTELNMNLHDYGARYYDAAVGRWWSIDPRCEDGGQESVTVYGYTFNDPIKHNDPDGRFPILANLVGAAVGAGTEYGLQVMTNIVENGEISVDAFTDVNGGDIFKSAVAGALGVGIAKGFSMIGKVKALASAANSPLGKIMTDLSSDAVSSVAGSVIQGDKVTAGGVLTDMTSGVIGKQVGQIAKNNAQNSKQGVALYKKVKYMTKT